MKRIPSGRLCAAVLAVLLLVAVIVPAVYAAETGGYKLTTAEAFTLSGDSAYTNPVRYESDSSVAALQEMLAKCGGLVSLPASPKELCKVVAEVNGKTRTYILYEKNGRYFIGRGSQCRGIAYSDFAAFLDTVMWWQDKATHNYFFKYTNPPLATSDIGKRASHVWYAGRGDYTFRSLDGSFLEYPFEDDVEFQMLPYSGDRIPMPAFAEQPDSVRYTLLHLEMAGDDIIRSQTELLTDVSRQEAAAYKLGSDAYMVRAKAAYNTPYYKGAVTYEVMIDTRRSGNTGGATGDIRFTVDGNDTHPGEVVVLRVSGTSLSDAPATYTSDISFTIEPKFFRRSDGSQIALFPVSYFNDVGEHWVEVRCAGKSARFTINAKDKTWQIQNLTTSAETAEQTINSQKANEEYEQAIAPLRSVADEQKYWSEGFIMPVSDQKVTTQFGMIRYTNGQPTSSRHGAIDLAVPRGTPVKATNNGRVLYAGFLQLTGNTVLIEHGYGLKSWYYHMDSLHVKTGDMVELGGGIGTVGSTGFSTGPHLHFGFSVNNVFINPYTVIGTELLHLE